MPPIIEGDLVDTIGEERSDGSEELFALGKIGIGRAQDAAELAPAAEPERYPVVWPCLASAECAH